MDKLIREVEEWSKDKNLDKGDSSKQMLKTIEEVGEVASALCRIDANPVALEDLKDGIGDVVVTLVILAQQNGLTLQECLDTAYNEIANRKGKTINGVFVKESDL